MLGFAVRFEPEPAEESSQGQEEDRDACQSPTLPDARFVLFLLQPLILLALGLPGGGHLGQGIVAKPDVTARLAALDPQLILAQQADRLGGIEQIRERRRAVPLALQTLAGHQPGRQRPVGLAIVELAEQTP